MPAKRKQARVEATDPAAAGDVAAEGTASAHDARGAGRAAATTASSACGSLNPVFALTGPRGGCLSARVASETLAQLADVVDDGALAVLAAAWACVEVPADQYWSVRAPQRDRFSGAASSGFSKPPVAVLRVPDPRHIQLSFYPTRLEAMAGVGYETRRNMLVLAADKRGGSGSKVFTVLSRDVSHPQAVEADNKDAHPIARNEEDEKEAAKDGTGDTPRDASSHASTAASHNTVAAFVEAVPRLYERCLYVLVDEAAAVDPYFDVDCHFTATDDRIEDKMPFLTHTEDRAAHGVAPQEIEALLAVILARLKQHVESFFATTVTECLVLTSTVQQQQAQPSGGHTLQDFKLSFHVHFRLHNREAVATVRDLHQCMAQLREQTESRIKALREVTEPLSASDQQELRDQHAVRQCVDFGVYTRWRAFRLPYNVKNPLDRGAAFTAVDAAADDLLESQLAQCGVLAGAGQALPDVAVGSIASELATTVRFCADPVRRATQQQLLRKMMFRLRALLPVVPGVTQLQADGALKAFLDAHAPRIVATTSAAAASSTTAAFASAVFDLASIQRDNTPLCPLSLLHAPVQGSGVDGNPSATTTTTAAAVDNPFKVPRPCFPRSVRQTVHDARRKELVAEVFRCLSPRYAGTGITTAAPATRTVTVDSFDQVQPAAPTSRALRDARAITADGLTVQYEESIRAYYATQKQNKYCLRQNRLHKATYAQLYLTYGSIKVRCYANDCCDRCLYVPWSSPVSAAATTTGTGTGTGSIASAGLPAVEGFPQYERLQAIHDELFPPLPLEEIVRRYGTEGTV